MRSVVVFLRDTIESAVTAYLDAAYPEQRDPWVVFVAGDACLYINLYRDGPREDEPEDWADIVQRFGGEPAVGVIADVSGRHPGDEQVAAFVAGLLSRFSGAAMDDYTPHLWSLNELRGGHRVRGHPFFDYNGWFAEKSR
ncbi:hypothetical protein WME79_41175 [Sorangium sp. So ce726]|uniref:hypothetical protein n=1 Tax=Sorangium sp. So ce726 TaxID=3133319 RepID=UPI003F60DEB0